MTTGFVEHLLDSCSGVLLDAPSSLLGFDLQPETFASCWHVEEVEHAGDDQAQEADGTENGQQRNHDSRRAASPTTWAMENAVMSAMPCSRVVASGQSCASWPSIWLTMATACIAC